MERLKAAPITSSHAPQNHKVPHGPLRHWLWAHGVVHRLQQFCSWLGDLTQEMARFTGSRLNKSSGNQCRPPCSQGSELSQEAIGKATITLVGPSHQWISRNHHYPLHIHSLLFCIFYVIAMPSPPFQTPLHKLIKLPDLISPQEQLRSLVRKCPMSHMLELQEYIICGINMPASSYSGSPQAGTDVSHYDLVYWKLVTTIWKNKYN